MLHRHNRYDKQKKDMNRQLVQMFTILDQMLADLSSYKAEKKPSKADEITKLEEEINKKEKSLEQTVIDLLSVQHATVKDMRDFLSKMKMSRDLERIGDHIISLLNTFQRTGSLPAWMLEELDSIISMERKMLEKIKDGILDENDRVIKETIAMDDQIDHSHMVLFEKLVRDMKESGIDADTGAELIMILRFLERLGDHIVNIGEAYLDFKS
ncbi:phosphate signaling complex PhoU family protein [Salisediminibacterium halotolerans]|uniref:phosphate signaling complex PhoU family protein n=1 Tax=Salisediminibacterium halotolerans TaxID=517425 RepID=UPI000EB3353D|nr:PhoU domain-containing protein [Salisediminibacterium halotolerans]RLJ72339.1 PhoU-like phosphate uptake regulator [Actinophytocola xinjiangensis]RPE85553.1 phosphate uptake regulator [Salisediminibacterium halotolerans]TWG33508.1 PhoU-like phosphate uptake regulator [Salisediminibacterium halotolerans]GEL08519.1 phosphate transport system regulatory protein PhoU [Salisediminibacterium halotolerans]